uniref:Microfibril associated protein 2 n=1 Tax=Erpetoichthys calabaricus TaxID=27687 RepID=A0A8C4X801_ERPCA
MYIYIYICILYIYIHRVLSIMLGTKAHCVSKHKSNNADMIKVHIADFHLKGFAYILVTPYSHDNTFSTGSPIVRSLMVSVAPLSGLLPAHKHFCVFLLTRDLLFVSDCREEQYPCTRLYSVHKPCRQCIKSLCFYNLRRVYVINKEVCVRTVCAHEELLRADLCRDQFSKCSVMAHTGLCGALGSSCAKSCGGC